MMVFHYLWFIYSLCQYITFENAVDPVSIYILPTILYHEKNAGLQDILFLYTIVKTNHYIF